MLHSRISSLKNNAAFTQASSRQTLSPIACLEKKRLLLYTKQDCPLCAGLEEKLKAVLLRAQFAPCALSDCVLEVRDIQMNEAWNSAYALEVPVLAIMDGTEEVILPRAPPRTTADRLQQHIEKAL
ncbi:hypothetical protein CEUSTIGMA_g12767.t1 [Chlamydomonas eustigma]|uniref:Glutaredoxin-like protein n=1 Tax=Chlamydomonas eustigma TaxID=1157962 RepID=A0A250XRB2_9CHLO|nr:hypothetical protein CEUSTIGMA_g12767.t1 [Chlamydomonas eustigma]|eukprot:GAX85350.1 hypothetical protein CEUSTIGMA_g12767.t1 [Chlamydomonas eustigma]